MKFAIRPVALVVMIGLSLATAGCESGRGTGTLAGAGVGALVGQVAGGTATSTLVGAGVGAAGGYIIGNEMDRAKARRGETESLADLEPLAGTAWTLVSVTPESARPAASMVIDFRNDGILFSTMTYHDGTVRTNEEHYRVVNQTLIVNDTNYIINGSFILQNRSLTFVVGDTTSRWKRVGGK